MCHMEKCFLCSFQFCCKIIHFMSLGLRCCEEVTNLPLLPFATVTSTLMTKFFLLQDRVSQRISPFLAQILLCNCDCGCCFIISISFLSFLRGKIGTWSRCGQCAILILFCWLLFPHGSQFSICLFDHRETQTQSSYGTIRSDAKFFPEW